MCTLTILPQETGFILTSNRDEAKSRMSASFPKYKKINDSQVLFPQDGDAHGSWVAINNYRVISLLNGAFEKYNHQPPYRKSRGIVLLDSFKYKKFKDFTADYDFNNIAPFTLVCLEHETDLSLEVFRWDGEKTHYKVLDAKKEHIFSSAPLYPLEIRNKREKMFQEFLVQKKESTPQDLIQFHQFGGDENVPIRLDENHFVRTVSITSIQKKKNQLQMQYHDLMKEKIITEPYRLSN